MTQFRTFPAILAATAALLVPVVGRADHGHHSGANVTIHDSGDPASCDQIEISFGSGRRSALRAEDRVVIPAGREPLRIVAAKSSGVRVRGADRRDFEVLACKAAPSPEALSAIRLESSGSEVTVAGPSGDSWVGYLIVQAPRGAALDVEATNGPIGLSGLSGTVTARAQNGPISIRDSGGEIQAEAENGPIHVRGDSGRVTVRTQNGPIGVSLTGTSWSGEGLDARAVNGPVHLAIPEGYASAGIVESLGHSPWRCRGRACSDARRSDDDDRRSLEFGAGAPVIHLATENGPVSIDNGNGAGDDEED
jgi:hypothetical protein